MISASVSVRKDHTGAIGVALDIAELGSRPRIHDAFVIESSAEHALIRAIGTGEVRMGAPTVREALSLFLDCAVIEILDAIERSE